MAYSKWCKHNRRERWFAHGGHRSYDTETEASIAEQAIEQENEEDERREKEAEEEEFNTRLEESKSMVCLDDRITKLEELIQDVLQR